MAEQFEESNMSYSVQMEQHGGNVGNVFSGKFVEQVVHPKVLGIVAVQRAGLVASGDGMGNGGFNTFQVDTKVANGAGGAGSSRAHGGASSRAQGGAGILHEGGFKIDFGSIWC